MVAYGKILVLTLNEQEEKVTNKIISAISDYIQIEPMHCCCRGKPAVPFADHPAPERSEVYERVFTV